MYTEPTVADDSKMKDSEVDADTLIDSKDLTGTQSVLYKMLQVTSCPSIINVCISSCWR